MEKAKYEWLKDIKNRIATGKPTTFAERNILNMENKKAKKKQKMHEQNFNKRLDTYLKKK